MKILLLSIGTRGDMEPFLAIGELLKEKGESVLCSFPEQFRDLAEESGLEFVSLGEKFIDLLDSDTGKAAMGGSSGFSRFMALIRLAGQQNEVNRDLVKRQYELIEKEQPDRIIYNGKAVYPILWELEHPGRTIFLSPLPFMHYVKGHSHVAFNSNFGEFFNKLSFSLAHFGMITTLMITKKWLQLKQKPGRNELRKVLRHGRSVYTISPVLFQRPDYWSEGIRVLGFHERKHPEERKPDKELLDFLSRHPKLLFITFGSMVNPRPEKKTAILLDIFERNRIPAIINTLGGGLVKPDTYDKKLFYFVSGIPYNLIFPKVYGVIHHGGSGTTHQALKNGCASLIIPHIIDQFVWNRIIRDSGAGPEGIKIGKLSTRRLEPKILDLLNNPSYKRKAEEIAEAMKQEDLREELYKTIVL